MFGRSWLENANLLNPQVFSGNILANLVLKKKEKKVEKSGSTKIAHLDTIFKKKGFFRQQIFSVLTFKVIYGKRKD